MQGFDDHAQRNAALGHHQGQHAPLGTVQHQGPPQGFAHDLHARGVYGRPSGVQYASAPASPADPIFIATAVVAFGTLLAAGLLAAITLTPTLTVAMVAGVVVVSILGGIAFEVAMRRPFLRTGLAATFAVVLVAAGSVGAARTASVNHRVNDPLPSAASGASATMPGTSTTLLQGTFQTLAHDTSGTAQVIAAAGGARQLALSDFRTSAGPDLQVYLTAGDTSGTSAGDFVTLGSLKGTSGNQLYDIPQGTDLTRYTNVVIWCRIASAAFGKAPLATTAGGDMHVDAMQGLPGGKATMANPATLFTGAFVGMAQPTSGTATITAGANDHRQLDLTGFTTAKGPDLQVYLVAGDPQVDADVADFVTLGGLRSTSGAQQYDIPQGVDLTRYTSVVIWCNQAKTSFGKAPLTRA